MTRALALRGFIVALSVAAATTVAAYLADLEHSAPRDWFALLAVAVVVGAIVSFLAFRTSGLALDSIASTAQELATGDLGKRADYIPGPMADLTTSFNGMADRLAEQFEELRADQARIAAVFAAANDGLIALSSNCTVLFLNPAAERLFGETSDQAIGRQFIEIARDYELDALVRRGLATTSDGDAPTAVVTFGPDRIPLRATAIPVLSGGTWAVLLTLADLTEVRRLDTVRRDFIGNVSHELRTPLAAIRALVETIESGYVEKDDMPEFLSRIHLQVDRLTGLVTELMDLTRIESGAAEMHPERLVVRDVLGEAMSAHQPRIEATGLEVVLTGDHELELESDRHAVVRILSNLLDNAIRFSPPGGQLTIDASSSGQLVSISVSDDGPGIPEVDLPRVFERFYTADKSRAQGGAGLGLAIVKHLVRAHNGTVEASSGPGRGATFRVSLPRRFTGMRSDGAVFHWRPEARPRS